MPSHTTYFRFLVLKCLFLYFSSVNKCLKLHGLYFLYFALVGRKKRKKKNTGGRSLQISALQGCFELLHLPIYIKIILINYVNFTTFSTAYLSLPLISFYKHFYNQFVKSISKISKMPLAP